MTMAVSIAGALTILFVTLEMLRRRQLREKYAALWIVVSLVAVVLALAPEALTTAAKTLGFGLPINLLFLGGFILLLVVSMQLSLETGRREDETERLAEEVALLRHEIAEIRSAPLSSGRAGDGSPDDERG